MKTYIFITRRICKIGGAEQYIYNKASFLESQGWRVLIFSGRKGPIFIDYFRRYENLIFPSLYYSPWCYRKSEVDNTLNAILEKIGDCGGDECIIESDAFSRAVWGELVASRLKCRHLAFLLQESHGYDDDMKEFLRFKYQRHELAGIVKDSVRKMLDDDTIELRDDAKIFTFCNNVFKDCEDKYSSLLDINADYTFGSFGRLEKPCVPAIVESFCSFARNHPESLINVVMVGGSSVKGKVESVRRTLETCQNIKAVITGDVYPVPVSFVKNIDVFVSTAGAATATFLLGLPTVKVHPVSGIPVGVMGLDEGMASKNMYDINDKETIENCINRALNHRIDIVYTKSLDQGYFDRMNSEFERQLTFVNYAAKNEYFDENKLRKLKTPHIRSQFKHWLSGHLFGGRGHELIREIFGKAK